jgi:CMP-N-acetylneuraminic acid synthetase
MIENNYLVFSEFTDSIKMENESYYPNGAIFYFKTNYIKENNEYYSKNTCLFEMEHSESIDIDTIYDFETAEKQLIENLINNSLQNRSYIKLK